MSFAVLVGRASGFVRESFVAATYGVGQSADLAVLILTVPDLLVNILVGGALSVALIPEFKRLSPSEGVSLFLQSSIMIGGVFLLLAAFLMIFSQQLIHLVAPGFSPDTASRAADVIKYVLWVIPLTALAGVSTAYLQAHERFTAPAFGTLIFNIVVIVGLFFFVSDEDSLRLLCGFVILGGLLRWFSQLVCLPRSYLRSGSFRPSLISHPLLIHYCQALGAGSLLLLFPVVARAMASFNDEGALATFNYATKLVEFPLGVSITLLAVLLFPRLAEGFAKDSSSIESKKILHEGVTIVLILSFSMMISMAWFSADLSRLAFGWGKMSKEAVNSIGVLAAIGFLSLPAQGVSSLVVAAFNAKRDTATPFYINIGAIMCFLPASWLAGHAYGLPGLMAAMTASYWIIMVLHIVVLRARHNISIGSALLNLGVVKIILASLIVFSPIAALSAMSDQGRLGNVIWAGVGVVLLMISGIMATTTYRAFIFDIIKKRSHD
ncbi:MAG: hypothetical protein M3A44_09850 [Gammaproteobacteria bacterium]